MSNIFKERGKNVKNSIVVVGLLLALGFFSNTAWALDDGNTQFVLDVLPASFLVSPDMDGFRLSSSTRIETIDGTGSYTPSLRAGIGFNTSKAQLDLTAGIGYLFNGAFTAPMYTGDLAGRFKIGEQITLGPHIGVIGFGEPDWDGNAQVSFSDSTGLMTGAVLTAGNEAISFSLSVDYIDASFDVTTSGGWTANNSTLDISGAMVNAGAIFRF